MNFQEEKFRKYSLINSLFFLILFIVIFTIVFINQNYRYNDLNTLKYKNHLEKDLKEKMIFRIDSLKDLIDLYHQNSQKTLKEDIKTSLDNIFVVLQKVYDSNKTKLTNQELKELIIKTINSFNNSKKNGYYFAIDMNSTKTYVHAREDFVGKSMIQIDGMNALEVFNSYKKALIDSPYNGGFAQAKVAKPNTKSMKLYDKTTYIKNFKPFDIMVGIGVYLDDYLEFEKDRIKNYIKTKNVDDGNFFFFDYNLNKSIKELFYENFRNARIISIENDFIEYSLNEEINLAYIYKYEDWNWYIGINLNKNKMNNLIEQNTQGFYEQLNAQIFLLITYGLIFIFFAVITSLYFSKKVEEKFKILKKELDEKNELNIKLKESNHLSEIFLIENVKINQISIMINSLIHQWYRPLNLIALKITNAQLDILNRKFTQEDIIRLINDIENSISFISQTTYTFTNFFKKESQYKAFNIYETVSKFIFIFDEIFKMNKIEVFYEIDKKSAIYCDENYLKQVLMSIVFNSVDILSIKKQENKEIKISLLENESYFILKIEDNAGGIDVKLLPDKLFEYKVSTKKDNLGLGLYLSKFIIEDKLNGKITANNSLDGAIFNIYLPK